MDVKIKFLDDFSLDRKLYWRVADIYNRYQWEIQYERLSLESPWMIRRHGSDVWHPIDGKKIAVELSARQIDADDFDRQLSSNIMTQAVFCSNLIDEAKKIFGAKSIEDAISNHNEFAEKLLEMIQGLTKQGGLKDSFEYSENISAEPVGLNDILGDFPTSASLFELTEPSSKPNSRLRLVKK